jgi:AhpD family alkylhydroperoxidase
VQGTRSVFQKRTYTVQGFLNELGRLARSLRIKQANTTRTEPFERAFTERIMLTVTQVNNCRYCDYGHSIAALDAGITPTELEAIKAGDFSDVPTEEVPALLFAQHYAFQAGSPEQEAVEALVTTYGEAQTTRIMSTIRMITIGNLLGNTFDALLSRLGGRPVASGSALNEIVVILLAIVSVPILMLIALGAVILRTLSRVLSLKDNHPPERRHIR